MKLQKLGKWVFFGIFENDLYLELNYLFLYMKIYDMDCSTIFSPHLIEILEKADYISILLEIEKGFPQINFIKLYHEM